MPRHLTDSWKMQSMLCLWIWDYWMSEKWKIRVNPKAVEWLIDWLIGLCTAADSWTGTTAIAALITQNARLRETRKLMENFRSITYVHLWGKISKKINLFQMMKTMLSSLWASGMTGVTMDEKLHSDYDTQLRRKLSVTAFPSSTRIGFSTITDSQKKTL